MLQLRWLVLAALLGPFVPGCSSPSPQRETRTELVGGEMRAAFTPEALEILALADARHTGNGRLQELLLGHADPLVRARAALALGRLPRERFGSEVTTPLCEALADVEPHVRAAVAFALGQRADPDCAGALLNFWNDPDPSVRARIVEAASYIDDPGVRAEILRSTGDGAEEVVSEAVIAPHRWPGDAPDAAEVDRALVLVLSRYPALPPSTETPPGAKVIWRTLFTLERRRSVHGRGAYLEHCDSTDPEARIFAVRGLAMLNERVADADVQRELVRACADPDWRVAAEAALGLGKRADSGVAALVAAVDHPSALVRRVALEALGTAGGEAKSVLPALWRGTRDLSASARAAAIGALVERLPPNEALELLAEKVRDRDPVVRAGAATAADALSAERAMPLLAPLVHDEDLFVAGAAIRALGTFAVPARTLLLDCLSGKDHGLALEAVLALRDSTQAGDLEPLVYALDAALASDADIATELAFSVLENLGRVGNEEARQSVAKALAHPHPHVRSVARRILAERFPGSPLPELATPASQPEPSAALDHDPFGSGRNPVAEVVTSRGSLVFELFPAEAPLHVQSFVELARRGYYDGLAFHRVVPDFVVQGGDYRGDGNGGRSAGGGSLRHEISPRKSGRGTLGMPRNDDLDSGGSQIFVTHRPTPHLDGRYTYFGELRSGVDVLDRIEVGDRIVSVRIQL